MVINKAYKFRVYPTKEQEVFLNKHFGSVRFIYNKLLATRQDAFKNGQRLSGKDAKKLIPVWKKQEKTSWLSEVNSQSLQQASLDLDDAYKHFFKGKAKFPQFKKKSYRNTFHVPQHFTINTEDQTITIPKLKTPLKVEMHREFGDIKKYCSLTFSKTPTGKFFVSILVEEKLPELKDYPTELVGLDLGLKHFITTSYGAKIDHPKYLRLQQRKLKRAQRKLSKKQKGSQNRKKQRRRVALLHEKVANQRRDFLHKLSYRFVLENQEIFIEDLNVKGMMKNRRLAKSIGDSGWSEFGRQLKYKCEWYGRKLTQIGRFEPSSKMCSNCNELNHELKLSDRVWVCSHCLVEHDRDINAAMNIAQIGLVKSDLKPVERTPSVRPVRAEQGDSLKQESRAS